MELNTHNVSLLLFYLPRALHDLMHHEDAALVKADFAKIHSKVIATPAPLAPLISTAGHSTRMGLLLQNYLHQLSTFDVSKADGEALLEHWRKIILEQPERLAATHSERWHDAKLKDYWQSTLAAHRVVHGISDNAFVDDWDNWQRASGAGHITDNYLQLQAMQNKQWQDLVIRTRMHHNTIKPTEYY